VRDEDEAVAARGFAAPLDRVCLGGRLVSSGSAEVRYAADSVRCGLVIVAVHKNPVELDLLLTTEPDIRLAMGYPPRSSR
jgi:hypothetical protein